MRWWALGGLCWGLAACGVGELRAATLAAEAIAPQQAKPAVMGKVVLDVNGTKHALELDTRTTLLDALRNRPPLQTVIVTGRAAKPELVELADTVSEIRDVKHAFNAGVKAQAGIDY